MSKMRIKKHKGVKLTETRHPPPKKDGGDEEEEKLLQCIMCNCMTIEEYLKRHIRYNHLISKDEIIDKLYKLHYPPESVSVSTQTTAVSVSSPYKGKHDDFDDTTQREKVPQKVVEDDEEVLCPACGDVEDGTPMVACAVCDSWYHWVCVGLSSKPVKGTEWLCTACSGKAGPSKVKRKMTPEVKAKRPRSPSAPESGSKRVLPGRRSKEESDGEQSAKHKKDNLPKKKEKPVLDFITQPEFSDDEEDNVHDDLHYSDDSFQDPGFEPQESDYDERDMRLSPGSKKPTPEREKKKKRPLRISGTPTDDDYDDMSRDDLRRLCQKELINATGARQELVGRLKRHFRKREEKAKLDEPKPKAKKYKLTEVTSGDSLCKICGLGWELPDDLELGPLYKYGACQAHLHCLMFSSGLIQGGDETEGIVGFMPPDVDRECERGAKLKCCFCREIYATVGCCQRTCMKTYHLPCGIKFGALNEYYGNFDSYCPSHRSKREVKPLKAKSKNYVLTDLGLVPEHVDREAGFDSEKYKDMLRKIEKQYGEKKKTSDIEVKKEKEVPAKPERKKRETYDEKLEEIKTRPGPKSKTILMRKKKFDEEEEESKNQETKKKSSPIPEPEEGDGARRGGRVRKQFGSDIYKSAKEELEAMLKKKEMVNLSDTFTNLAGTRRQTSSVYNKNLGDDEEEEDRKSKKARAAKRAMVEVDDEDDDEGFVPKRSTPTLSKKVGRRLSKKSPLSESEEEDSKTYKKILKKKKSKRDQGSSGQSDEDEPVAKNTARRIKIKPMPEKKANSESEDEKPKKITKNKKVLTPEPDEVEEHGDRRRRSKKVITPEPEELEPDPELEPEQEPEPERRRPGPKRRKVLTPEAKGNDSNEEEGIKSLKRGNRREDESIESIHDFIVGSGLKDQKGSDSGSDNGFNKLKTKIKLTKTKKTTVESGDEGDRSPPVMENEFEDTEQDNVSEIMGQNDGFIDTSGIVSANVSDEGADIEKPSFHDEEEDDTNFDFSDIITKLDVEFEIEPFWHDIEHCYRFKCKVCGLYNRDQEKMEEHLRSTHNKKVPRKMITKQEMMINMERKPLSAENKKLAEAMIARMKGESKEKEMSGVKSTPAGKTGKKKVPKVDKVEANPAELTGELYPFFKYANDDITDTMVDRRQVNEKSKDRKEKTSDSDTTEQKKRIFDSKKEKMPVKDTVEDAIESLLMDDSPEKPVVSELPKKKKVQLRKSKEEEDEPEAKSVSRKKTSLGKDFILWENDDKSSSRRSSRSSKQSFTGEEALQERSSRQNTVSSKSKLAKDDDISTSSTREGSPVNEGFPEILTNSDTEKKDDEPLRRRRKSPPKRIIDRPTVDTEMGRGALSPVPSGGIVGPVFECLKCDTKLMQRKDLVMTHLKTHKLNFESYIDVYLEENGPDKLSAIIEWRAEDQPEKNEDLFNSLMAEGPSLPLHLGPKIGRADPKEKPPASGPKLGSTSLIVNETEEKKNVSKLVLFSTLGAAEPAQKEDPLSNALSSILTDEEKQELLLSPLKRTLNSAGIELAESEGEEKQNFFLRVKMNKH